LDGSGYPRGLAGDAIPLGARILAVADSFDAMTSSRPYRPARSRDEALAELHAQAGVLFDPAIVLCLDEIARGVDVVAARDLRQPLVERPAVRTLLA
jgi:HD-GYP domain-containing protein (c-di-GMP phosphodiesterase class II)